MTVREAKQITVVVRDILYSSTGHIAFATYIRYIANYSNSWSFQAYIVDVLKQCDVSLQCYLNHKVIGTVKMLGLNMVFLTKVITVKTVVVGSSGVYYRRKRPLTHSKDALRSTNIPLPES